MGLRDPLHRCEPQPDARLAAGSATNVRLEQSRQKLAGNARTSIRHLDTGQLPNIAHAHGDSSLVPVLAHVLDGVVQQVCHQAGEDAGTTRHCTRRYRLHRQIDLLFAGGHTECVSQVVEDGFQLNAYARCGPGAGASEIEQSIHDELHALQALHPTLSGGPRPLIGTRRCSGDSQRHRCRGQRAQDVVRHPSRELF